MEDNNELSTRADNMLGELKRQRDRLADELATIAGELGVVRAELAAYKAKSIEQSPV